MKGEEAMEIFKIVRAKGMLPKKMDDLVPLSFIGQTAVTFYRQMIKGFDQLKMTEAQRKRTLKDGQEAGEMLLDIEARIGELLPSVKESLQAGGRIGGKIRQGKPSPMRVRPEGITEHRATHARAIAAHPEIVEKVKAQARENEDIPTRTAVINEIRHQTVKSRFEEKIKEKDVYNLEQELLGMVDIAESLKRKLIRIRMKVEELDVKNITGLNPIITKFKMRDLIEELKWLWDILGEGRKQINQKEATR